MLYGLNTGELYWIFTSRMGNERIGSLNILSLLEILLKGCLSNIVFS